MSTALARWSRPRQDHRAPDGGRALGPVGWDSHLGEGQYIRRRYARSRWGSLLLRAGARPRPRRHLCRTAARCRRRSWQDDDAGARHVGPHGQSVVGCHAQSLGSRADARRVVGARRRRSRPGSRRSRSVPTWAVAHGFRRHIPVSGDAAFDRADSRRFGFPATAIDFQVIGPFARTMRDMRLLLQVHSPAPIVATVLVGFRPLRTSRSTVVCGSVGSLRSVMKARRRGRGQRRRRGSRRSCRPRIVRSPRFPPRSTSPLCAPCTPC